MLAADDTIDYSPPPAVLPMQQALFGEASGRGLLRQFQRLGEGPDKWRATDARSYAFLGIPVRKGEVVDDAGELDDYDESEGGQWVCLSPNSPDILKPALGLRSPHLFSDGCYGFDDRSRWPQIYSPKFEYYACIPRFSRERAILWWAPDRIECIPIPGAVDREVCVLSPRIADQLKVQCHECCGAVWKVMETEKDEEPALLVTHLLETLDRLAMGLSYRNLVQDVGELQRTCLDLLGWVNLVTTFLPRALIRTSQDNKVYDVDLSVMGAFTHSIPAAQRLFRLGLPVYLIRPSSRLPPDMNVQPSYPTTLLDKSMGNGAPSVVLEEFVTTRRGPYPFPVVVNKFPGVELQEALQRFSIRISNRRHSAIGTTSVNMMESGGNSDPRAVKLMPFVVYQLTKASGSLSSAGPTSSLSMTTAADARLIDVQPILSWRSTLERYEVGTYDKGLSKELTGTVLPPPNIFDTNRDETSKNCRVYAAGYIAMRPIYLPTVIEHALSTGEPRSFPTGQQWRNFLVTFKKSIPLPDGVRIGDGAGSAKKKRHASRQAPAGPPIKRQRTPASSGTPSAPPSTSTISAPSSSSLTPSAPSNNPPSGDTASSSLPPTRGKRKFHPLHQELPPYQEDLVHICWLDKQIPILSLAQLQREVTDDILCEVRWEVHEQNFRLELLILDQVLCPELWRVGEGDSVEVRSARKERELALRRVFPANGSYHANFFVQDIPNVDGGVASRDWRDRAHFFLAFREVVLAWPDCSVRIRDASLDVTKEFDMVVLENIVVELYCSRFLRQFGRLPTPPVRLPFISLSRKSPAAFYSGLLADDRQS